MHPFFASTRQSGSDRAPWPVLLVTLVLGVLIVEAVCTLALLLRDIEPVTRNSLIALDLFMLPAAILLLHYILTFGKRGRRARDDEFAEVRRRLDLAMEASQIGFWDVDLNTDRLRWDARACQHMGAKLRPGGYFTEADWLGAVHPDDRERAVRAAQAAIATGGRFISDYRVVWSSGEIRHLRDMAAYHRSGDGTPRLVGLVWDVTADKEREAELELRRKQAEAANKAKSSFLAAMSHEIRTPLAGVIGMLDLMQADSLTGEQAKRARIATASAQSLLQLLNDVLDLSKLEAAAVTLAPEGVEVRRLVQDVSDLMAARAAQKGLSFSCRVDEDVPGWVSIDPVRFRQVLTNITSNALAYTDEGFVSVRVLTAVVSDGDGLEVVVSDSGIGIADEDRERVFERFVQADAATKRQSGGTGLGLAIAREIAGLMGGEIAVESTLGVGSTFTFTLNAPACPWPELAAEAPGETTPPAPPLDILVAEDNATNRFLMSSYLRRGGHRTTIVENGREAVEALRISRFDVVLMDVQMPEMDGLAASRAIRDLDSPNRHVPIVALTASVLSDDRARYVEAGMDDCLAKPFDAFALNAVLVRSSRRTVADAIPTT